MTTEQLIAELKSLARSADATKAHQRADELMKVALLKKAAWFGKSISQKQALEIIAAFNKVPKWYE